MAFKLNLDIGGQCLFVSETGATPAENRMHVVMPANGNHGSHRHVPLLKFDAAHLAGSAYPLNAMTVYVVLRDQILDIPGSGASLFRCPDIADLTPVVTRPFHRNVLETDPAERITSRITLGAGGMNGMYPGVCWEWEQGVARRLSHRVMWTMELDTDPFKLELKQLRTEGHPVVRTIELKPLPDGTGAINLTIVHSPLEELPIDVDELSPAKPAYDAPAPHFEEFYSLFEAGTAIRVPLFRCLEGCTPLGTGTECAVLGDAGGSPFSCMVAGVTL